MKARSHQNNMITDLCFGSLIEITQRAFLIISVNTNSSSIETAKKSWITLFNEILPFVTKNGQNGKIVPFEFLTCDEHHIKASLF